MDERDDSLAQLYRRSSREEPPARVDLAVMEMARRAGKRGAWSPFGNHWLATGAVAAVALASVLLVVLMQEQTSLTALPDAGRERDAGTETIRLPLPPPKGLRDSDEAAADRGPAAAKREQPEAGAAQAAGDQALRSAVPATELPHESGPPPPRFDFYETLPEMRVAVPQQTPEQQTQEQQTPEQTAGAEAIPQPPPASQPAIAQPTQPKVVPVPQPGAAPAAARATGYFLQVGAFQAADAADRFKTRLEALHLPASVEAITLDNRETWHRVRVGPYRDPATADDVRSLLKAQGIDSLLVKTGE